MMIALANDHVGLELKKIVMAYLDERGLAYHDYGTFTEDRSNYPEFALKAANAVASGECDRGILICGTGIGIGISANKVKGIRCAMVSDCFSAKLTRQHNDANMISIGARVVGQGLALMIIEQFLDTEYEGGRHQVRVDQIRSIEETGGI